MHKFRTILGAAATAVGLILALYATSAGAAAKAAPTLEDRQAIDDVLSRNAFALDQTDPDAYASTFTQDATFDGGEMGVKHGRQELRGLVEGLKQMIRGASAPGAAPASQMRLRHVVTNGAVKFLNDHQAQHQAYWMTIRAVGDKYEIIQMGHYNDTLVKDHGQWLISVRRDTHD